MALAAKIATSAMHLVTVGLEPHELHSLALVFEHCRTTHLAMDINQLATGAIMKASEGGAEIKPDLIICGEPRVNVTLDEVAQTLRMTYPKTPIFCVCRNRKKYNRKSLVKNGFNDAFLFPLEVGSMRRSVFQTLNKMTGGVVKAFRPVKVSELPLGSVLPCKFSVFLATNNKHVHIFNEGITFDEGQLKKLTERNITTLYVDDPDLPAFYAFALSEKRKKDPTETMSITERLHRLEDEARRLLGGLFRAEERVMLEDGEKTVREMKEVLKTYILDPSTYSFRYLLSTAMGAPEDSYTHAANVALYAAIFAAGASACDPADVALAGLLHDIGVVDLPEAIGIKPIVEHTVDDAKIYSTHVQSTMTVMQDHKMTVTGPVMKAVMQHHERFDATGYPAKVVAAGICKEAMIVAAADIFDEATRHVLGQPTATTKELLDRFKAAAVGDGKAAAVDPALIEKIMKLFSEAV